MPTPGHELDHALVPESKRIAVMRDAANGSDQRGFSKGDSRFPGGRRTSIRIHGNLRRLLDYENEVGFVSQGSNVLTDTHGNLDRYVNPT